MNLTLCHRYFAVVTATTIGTEPRVPLGVLAGMHMCIRHWPFGHWPSVFFFHEGYGDLVPTVPGARLWLIFTALPMLGFVAFFVEHWVDTFQLIEGSIRKACVAKR